MSAPILGIALLTALAAGGLCAYLIHSARQITYVTLADGRRQERRLPLFLRWMLPFAPNLLPLCRSPALAPTVQRANRRLVAAGFEGLLEGAEFIALRILLGLGGFFLIAGLHLLLRQMAPPGVSLGPRLLLLEAAILLYLLCFPALWLAAAERRRQGQIERALPFVLDLLTLSVEAGLDFMTAIKRIVDRRALDPLAEELIRVFREVQVGRTRREALRDLANRTGQTDLRTVVNALLQADELGVSIGAMLRIQADQMRTRRFQRAERIANQAPVKMLFPLVAFIFPAVFIVLLGPVVLQILRHGF